MTWPICVFACFVALLFFLIALFFVVYFNECDREDRLINQMKEKKEQLPSLQYIIIPHSKQPEELPIQSDKKKVIN